MFRTRTSSQDSSASSAHSHRPNISAQPSSLKAGADGTQSPLVTNIPRVAAQPPQDDSKDSKKEKRKTFLGFAMKDKSTSSSKLSTSRSANNISSLSAGSQPRSSFNGQRVVSTPSIPSGTAVSQAANQQSLSSGPQESRQKPTSMLGRPQIPPKDSPPLHGFMRSSPAPLPTGRSAESFQSGDTAGTSSTPLSNLPMGRPPMNHLASHDSSVNGSFHSSRHSQVSTPPAIPGMKVNPALVQVFRPLLELIANQAKKLYGASPPEVEMIFARAANGGQPKQGPPGSPRNDWDSAWMQLTGTSLSIWSMKETAEADKRGERVPPTYYNVTDSSLELLAPLPPPPHRAGSHPHPFVFSLNTAGSNRILFSCTSEANLAFWVTALRLAAWEKSRIEEIYTGHALRTFIKSSPSQNAPITYGEKATWNEPRSPLQKGKLEGWVKVRVMGGTDWKRLYLVLSSAETGENKHESIDKKRRSMFSFGSSHDVKAPEAGPASTKQPTAMTSIASAVFFQSPPGKTKLAKGATPSAPVLTVTHISQAFAVFPEHLEVVTSSNLLKVVGHISGEMVVVEGRQRLSGWIMIMPERPEMDPQVSEEASPPVLDMLRWCVGIHDAFGLYGRPERYNWNPKDPASLFFGYPEVLSSERLFLDASIEQVVDYRQDIIAGIRLAYSTMYTRRLEGLGQNSASPGSNGRVSDSPREGLSGINGGAQNNGSSASSRSALSPGSDQALPTPSFDNASNLRLPPLVFEGSHLDHPPRSDALTPIMEVASRKTSNSTLRTNERQKSMGSQSSARDRLQYSGSGSSGPKGGGIMGTRLEDALVTETLTSSPLPDEGSLAEIPQTTPRPEVPRQSQAVQTPTNEVKGAELSHHSSISSYSQYSQPTPSNAVQGLLPLERTETVETLQPAERVANIATPEDELKPLLGKTLLTDVPLNGSSKESVSDANDSHGIIAPKPQRPTQLSPNGDRLLQDEATAIFLWQENQDKTSGAEVSQPTADTQASSRPADQRLRPRIVTDVGSASKGALAVPLPPQAIAGERQNRSPLGRKPSGARAMPAKRQASGSSSIPSASSSKSPPDDLSQSREYAADASVENTVPLHQDNGRSIPASASLDRDAMAAMTFLDAAESPKKPATLTHDDPKSVSPPPQQKSSFALSKTAAERRARAERADRQREASYREPGLAGRKTKRPTKKQGNWSASSDEEDENEDAEDDDEREEVEVSSRPNSRQQVQPRGYKDGSGQNLDSQANLGHGQPPRPLPDPILPQRRASRNLPPIPGSGGRAVSVIGTEHMASQRQWQESGAGNRTSSYSVLPTQQRERLAEAPLPSVRPAPRNSVWVSSLDAEHTGIDPNQNNTGKFVSLEPSAQLTKAFVPHGLLQAGLQDKEDRSARKQEEVARETGSSLVNVPNKPPPPQTGLLGAITAHERDRKGAGGIGAALTERERDRRVAEERQRQIDDLENLQRQQMMSQSGGDFPRPMSAVGYGAMMPPMPYPGSAMMWPNSFNPYAQQQQQQMFQQQAMMAAQQAYQQSLYAAISMAGSQAGDMDGRVGSATSVAGGFPSMTPPPMNMGYGGMPSYMPPYGMMAGSPMMTPFMGSFPPNAAYPPGMTADMPQSRMSSYNLVGDRGPIQEQRTGSPMRQGGQGRASPRLPVT